MKGFGILELVISALLISFLTVILMRQFSVMNKAERNVAANNEFHTIVNAMDLMLSTQTSCGSSGLTKLKFDPQNPGATQVTIITPGNPTQPFLQLGKMPNLGYNITKLQTVSMSSMGGNASGIMSYFTELDLSADKMDPNPVGGSTRQHQFFLEIDLDQSSGKPPYPVVTCGPQAGPFQVCTFLGGTLDPSTNQCVLTQSFAIPLYQIQNRINQPVTMCGGNCFQQNPPVPPVSPASSVNTSCAHVVDGSDFFFAMSGCAECCTGGVGSCQPILPTASGGGAAPIPQNDVFKSGYAVACDEALVYPVPTLVCTCLRT